MEKKIRIAAAGDNCVDVYDKEGKAFPGGNPLNVAVYVARLGGESTYVGAVGTDSYGKMMIDAIKGKGVDVSHLKVLDGNTAVTHVEIVDGDRILGEYEEGVLADFKLNKDDIDFLCGYDMVVGIAIPYVDYAFFAIDDKDDDEIKSFMIEMHKKGPKVVVVTRGEKGSMAYDGKDFYSYGIVECDVVDTMGAGDSYIAGFLYAVCQGKNIPDAMADGAKNSSITISYFGAW